MARRLVPEPTAEAAAACHRHVRDAIAFGFPAERLHYRASEVLTAGVADGLGKSTLLTALWRASGQEARQYITRLPAAFLSGLVYPGPHLVHAVTELRVAGRWYRTDSYLLDAPLLLRVREALGRGPNQLGWGHDGSLQLEWDGTKDGLLDVTQDSGLEGPFEDLGTWLAADPGQLHDHPLHGQSWREVRQDAQQRLNRLRARRTLPLPGQDT
ncbi:MAG: transglutaminase domain-containing protein [Candidatus Sericytochromatia bacterium]|nr:transglutaminase domain-containing protein [Candidatus Sericytochromatia bacterium]